MILAERGRMRIARDVHLGTGRPRLSFERRGTIDNQMLKLPQKLERDPTVPVHFKIAPKVPLQVPA